MKNHCLYFISTIINTSPRVCKDSVKIWTGTISFFNQSSYNKQWLGGGTSNIAGILV
jgi:hypothetical protein